MIARISITTIFLGLGLASSVAYGTTYTVTNTSTGGAGSLTEALISANANLGLDTIEFAIPGPGPHVINKSQFLVTDELVLDGYSQPGAVQNTGDDSSPWNGVLQIVIDGDGTTGALLLLLGGNIEVRGLAFVNGDDWAIHGSNDGDHRIFGCLVGWDPSGILADNDDAIWLEGNANMLGDVNPWQRNVVVNNVRIEGDDNLIRGNLLQLTMDGVSQGFPLPFLTGSVGIIGNGNLLGGRAIGTRNIIGKTCTVIGDGNRIRGNYIGVEATGGRVAYMPEIALRISSGVGNAVGGVANGSGNFIYGRLYGVSVSGAATATTIRRNSIGVSWDGSDVGCLFAGIEVFGDGTLIGGSNANHGNVIRNNGSGVVVFGQGITIRGNEIQDNFSSSAYTTLGIDLGEDGVTANDPGDGDTGANQFINFPVITDIVPTGSDYVVHAEVEGISGLPYEIEFFSSPNCDASGHGEGETRIHVESVTPSGGLSTFTFTIPQSAAPDGSFLTATNTDIGGNTSEFSTCREAVTTSVVTASDSGYGSLRRAIEYAYTTAGPRIVTIRMPSQIDLLTPLPAINQQIEIFGFSSSAGTKISGALLPAGSDGLVITADDCRFDDLTMVDFDGDGFQVSGISQNFVDCGAISCGIGLNQLSGQLLADCEFQACSVGAWLRGNDSIILDGYAIDGDTGYIVEADRVRLDRADSAGHSGNGIWLRSTADDTEISGAGGIFDNQGAGVLIQGTGTLIETMQIHDNAAAGIRVSSGSGHLIRKNRFSSNGGIGIDLGSDGVTFNDPLDADTGVNGLLNYPELMAVEHFGPGCPIRLNGVYQGEADKTVSVDVYTNDGCDPTGYGEGQTLLFSIDLTTDGAGNAAFQECLDESIPIGTAFTSQANDGINASEFGPCISSVVTAILPTQAPKTNALLANRPNPFRGQTTIAFEIVREDTPVHLAVFDLRGRKVRQMERRSYPVGRHSVTWDRRDDYGQKAAAGVYVVRLTAGAEVFSRKLAVFD